MDNEKLLDLILDKKFAESKQRLNSNDRKFLIRYSIEKDSQGNNILKELGESDGVDAYFKKREYVANIRNELQSVFDRYNELKKRDANAFDNSFNCFLEWWYSNSDEKGNNHCYYCGIDEETSEKAFKSKILTSKKRSFSGKLQIERKNPENGYNSHNCELACVLCNNAKSDMISDSDFITYFAPSFEKYWNHIKDVLEQGCN